MSYGSAPVIMPASTEKPNMNYEALSQIIAFGSYSEYMNAVKANNVDAIEGQEYEEDK